MTLSPSAFFDRHRLASQHRFVDLRGPLGDFAVNRNLVTGPDDHDVAHQHLGCRDLDFPAFAQDHRLGRRKIHERPDRVRGASAGSHLQPVAEQDEHQQYRCGFVEHFAFEEERRAHAEQVTGAHAQHDQRGHVQHAVPGGAPRRHEERPPRIGDRRGGSHEQEHLAIHAEWRGKVSEHRSHRRIQEDRDRENERDEEPVAHVPNHVLHRHAGAMAHVVHHVAHLVFGVRCALAWRTGDSFDCVIDYGAGWPRRSGRRHRFCRTLMAVSTTLVASRQRDAWLRDPPGTRA